MALPTVAVRRVLEELVAYGLATRLSHTGRRRTLVGFNDGVVWPLIPFPDSWYAAC